LNRRGKTATYGEKEMPTQKAREKGTRTERGGGQKSLKLVFEPKMWEKGTKNNCGKCREGSSYGSSVAGKKQFEEEEKGGPSVDGGRTKRGCNDRN